VCLTMYWLHTPIMSWIVARRKLGFRMGSQQGANNPATRPLTATESIAATRLFITTAQAL
jgi:hypothetical protein